MSETYKIVVLSFRAALVVFTVIAFLAYACEFEGVWIAG
jgi:hypothetical protein